MNERVRAIIIEKGSVVLIHRIKKDKEYWVFPGGGVEESDLSPQAGLKRECREELGVEVEVDGLFMERPSDPPEASQTEYFYFCHIISGELGTGTGPEFERNPETSGTYTIQKVSLAALSSMNLYPTDVRDRLATVEL